MSAQRKKAEVEISTFMSAKLTHQSHCGIRWCVLALSGVPAGRGNPRLPVCAGCQGSTQAVCSSRMRNRICQVY